MLDGLLDTGDLGSQRVIRGLDCIECVITVRVLYPMLFNGGIHLLVLGMNRFQFDLQFANCLGGDFYLAVQLLPLQCLQLGFEVTLLCLELGIFFCRLGLPLQVLQLTLQFIAQIGQAIKIFHGAAHATRGFLAALFIFGNACRFLDENAQLLWLGFDESANHALFDNGIATRAQAGTQENIRDIPATAFGAIEKVIGLRLSADQASDGYLGVSGILAAYTAITVIKHQFDRGLSHRLAIHRAVEDDIRHGLATQIFGRTFAHYPTYRIDNIGFSAAIRANHCTHIARKIDRRGIDEGLETRQLDRL